MKPSIEEISCCPVLASGVVSCGNGGSFLPLHAQSWLQSRAMATNKLEASAKWQSTSHEVLEILDRTHSSYLHAVSWSLDRMRNHHFELR